MSAIYVDASALMRVLFGGPGVQAPMGPGFVTTSSEFVEIETVRTLYLLRLRGKLDSGQLAFHLRALDELLKWLHLFPVSSEVVRGARAAFPMPVSASQALHIATARLVLIESGELEFWTHAVDQAAPAIASGLVVRGTEIEA